MLRLQINRQPANARSCLRFSDSQQYFSAASGRFGPVASHLYPWNCEYGARSYAEMLQTHSDHLGLSEAERTALLKGVDAAIQGHGGSVDVCYVARLLLAQRNA